MPFYVKKATDDIQHVMDPQVLVDRLPHHQNTFDLMAQDQQMAWDNRTPSSWGPVMQGAADWKRVARFPQSVWAMLCQMHDEGLAPDPLKDDKYFYGLLFAHPIYQAYPMKREG